ncbi:MAG: glycerate kinase [Clostridia bacterium]|nr:glycerate kinase [Clostridia bacterium]
MKIIIAPDSFKGSLSSAEVIKIIGKEAKNAFDEAEIIGVPLADGGEGTVDAMLFDDAGVKKTCAVSGPLGKIVNAEYGMMDDTAIIEMASCSGLTLVPESLRNPMKTTSRGTGEMIKHVLDEGIRNIIIGIGGSATNDGGIGAMQALGAEFYDAENNLINTGNGEKLSEISRIELKNFDKRVRNCRIKVMCDVTNPLTGERGATYTYSRQKGADEETLDLLEKGMRNYEDILNKCFGREISKISGAGAAGGMGAALLGFCGAELVSGIGLLLEIKKFSERIKGADLIITGEGRVDGQSAYGKAVQGIAGYADKANVPVIVIAGSVGEGYEKAYDFGVKAIFSIADRPMSLDECMNKSKSLLRSIAKNIFELISLFTN